MRARRIGFIMCWYRRNLKAVGIFIIRRKKSTSLELRDAKGQKVIKETSYADVKLVPIPFISVRKSIEGKRRGLPALAQLAVEGAGKKPDKRYGTKMEREKIKIIS